MTSNSRHPAFEIKPGLWDTPLPLTVAGVETFFGDIIARLASVRHGFVAVDLKLEDLVAYGERRMPAVFSVEASIRGLTIVTLEEVMERVEVAPPPDGGMTWPPNPQWLADLVNEFVPDLILYWALLNVHLPGTTEVRRRAEQALPKVIENSWQQASTGFLRVEETGTTQYTIRCEDGILHFGRRIRGTNGFERFFEIPVGARDAILALLGWHRGTSKNESVSRHR